MDDGFLGNISNNWWTIDVFQLYNFFNALLTHIPDTVSKQTDSCESSRSSSTGELILLSFHCCRSTAVDGFVFAEGIDMKFSDESDELAEEGISGPEKQAYRGPHITFPLTKKDLDALIDLFRKKKYNRLHPKYVAGILREAKARLKRQPNLNQASTAISKQVTICGDLHGKLDDLLVIFHKVSIISSINSWEKILRASCVPSQVSYFPLGIFSSRTDLNSSSSCVYLERCFKELFYEGDHCALREKYYIPILRSNLHFYSKQTKEYQ